MCLYNDLEKVKKLQKRFDGVNYIICYKYIKPMYINRSSFRTPKYISKQQPSKSVPNHFIAPFYCVTYKNGWNISNSRAKGVCSRNNKEINNGIHVRLTKERERFDDNNFNKCILVQCKCYKEDLIGASHNEAVFKKIYMSLPEHSAQVKKKRRKK